MNLFCAEMEKLVKTVVLLLAVACSRSFGMPPNTGEGGLVSGGGEPGDVDDTMIDDEDFATAADAPFEVWAHSSEPCSNWFATGENMETVKGVFRSALKKTIQTQCNCKIDISNDNISCKGVVHFTGNLNTEGMNNIDVSSIVGVWARNVNSRRIRISTLTTLTIAESRTAAINIGDASPVDDINSLATPASVNVGGVVSAAMNTGIHICALVTAATLSIAQLL